MKHYETDANGRDVDDEEANAIDDLTEGLPDEPLPRKNLPNIGRLRSEEDKEKGGIGMEKALDQMDEYEKDLPKRDGGE